MPCLVAVTLSRRGRVLRSFSLLENIYHDKSGIPAYCMIPHPVGRYIRQPQHTRRFDRDTKWKKKREHKRFTTQSSRSLCYSFRSSSNVFIKLEFFQQLTRRFDRNTTWKTSESISVLPRRGFAFPLIQVFTQARMFFSWRPSIFIWSINSKYTKHILYGTSSDSDCKPGSSHTPILDRVAKTDHTLDSSYLYTNNRLLCLFDFESCPSLVTV